MATLNSGKHGESGQAIVELALTLPLLLVVVLGICDFGLMFQRYEVVTNAAREGARVAVLAGYTPAQAKQHAINYLISGAVPIPVGGVTDTNDCTGTSVSGRVCVNVVNGTATIGGTPTITVNQKVVTVSYDHQHVFVGPILQLFGGSLGITRLQSTSRMRNEDG